MPKEENRQTYKTEEQLKREAMRQREAEKKAAAARPPKSDSAKKRENFWYHYKWHTIGIGIAVIIGAFFIKDTLFRANPDMTIIMVSGDYFPSESVDDLAAALEQIARDYNDDKKVLVSVDSIMLPSETQASSDDTLGAGAQQEYASIIKLTAVIAAGSDPVYLLDEASYEYITAMGGDSDSESAFTELSVSAEDLAFQNPANAELFSGMRFYIRQPSLWEKKPEYYRYCEELLQAVAALA